VKESVNILVVYLYMGYISHCTTRKCHNSRDNSSLHLDDLCHIQSVPGDKVNILGSHNIGHSMQKKNVYIYAYMRPIPTVSELESFHCIFPTLLMIKRYYVLFIMPLFIVQVTKLVQFIYYNTFLQILTSTSMHSQLASGHGVLHV
jgi:hypothetical protein